MVKSGKAMELILVRLSLGGSCEAKRAATGAEPWIRSRIKSACGMARHISEGRGKRKRERSHVPASARRRAVVILSHPPINAESTGPRGANSNCLQSGNRV